MMVALESAETALKIDKRKRELGLSLDDKLSKEEMIQIGGIWMRAVCNKLEIKSPCETNIYENEFEVKSLDEGKCPECGSSEIAPAWIKNFRVPGEEDRIKELQICYEECKKRGLL